jgi:glycosyltransferase involved in cell wall biosynthesis
VISEIGDPGNLCVRYNPLNDELIRNKANNEIVNRSADTLFVTVGRLDKHKQYDLLIDVVNELNKKFKFELWVIGEGDQRETLESKISEFKLKNVKVLGRLDNPYPYMKAADCFICSSISESFGLSIQESLVLGVPVIAADCEAVKELVDPRYGIITANSFEGLKSGIESVLTSPELLLKMKRELKDAFQAREVYLSRLKAISAVWENEYE